MKLKATYKLEQDMLLVLGLGCMPLASIVLLWLSFIISFLFIFFNIQKTFI